MNHPIFKPEWRTQNPTKRRIYAKYMSWFEKGGYALVATLFALFLASFWVKVDDKISADEVTLTAPSTPINATEETLVVEWLVKDFDDVTAGQVLARIVAGADAVKAARIALAEAEVQSLRSGQAAAAPSLATVELKAPQSGVVRVEAEAGFRFNAGTRLARVVDYNHIELQANLNGQSVGNADAGQPATLSQISIAGEGATIIRANVNGNKDDQILSRSLAGSDVRDAIKKAVEGELVQVRDDIPLAIQDVTSVEVDGKVALGSGFPRGAPMPLDPGAEFTLTGKVVAGEHQAEVQLADLPPTAMAAAADVLNSRLKGTQVAQPDGTDPIILGAVTDTRFVIKAKASAAPAGQKATRRATSLSRIYAATIRIDAPPAFLAVRLRQADQLGQKVTAKVEVTTGSRPVALILLRRS